MTKPLTRMCKAPSCKIRFEPISPNQVVHTAECATEYSKHLREKKEKKMLLEIHRKNKLTKEKLKTLSEHLKEFQVIFNTFIRLRDRGKPCISCGRSLEGRKVNASHFWSVGGNPSVRFDLFNAHNSCVPCNQHKHGNLQDYAIRLPGRIGQAEFEALNTRRTQSRKYTIPELIDLKQLFKQKIKLAK